MSATVGCTSMARPRIGQGRREHSNLWAGDEGFSSTASSPVISIGGLSAWSTCITTATLEQNCFAGSDMSLRLGVCSSFPLRMARLVEYVSWSFGPGLALPLRLPSIVAWMWRIASIVELRWPGYHLPYYPGHGTQSNKQSLAGYALR